MLARSLRGKVVDRLRRGRRHQAHRRRKVLPAAAVAQHVALEDLNLPLSAVDRDAVAHAEAVALEAGLELLVAIVGQAHRSAVAVQARHQRVERERAVVLGAVADGVARMQHQPLHAEAAGGQHARAVLGHFVRRLRGDDEVQRTALAASNQPLPLSSSNAAVSMDCEKYSRSSTSLPSAGFIQRRPIALACAMPLRIDLAVGIGLRPLRRVLAGSRAETAACP